MAASVYASGAATKEPDILVFHLCQLFGCTPSQLEVEDPILLEKFLLIDSVMSSKINKSVEA